MARRLSIGFKTSPQGVDWPTLDETWRSAGSMDVFDSAWVNDHLVHPAAERHGPVFESFAVLAALARHVPRLWIGHLVTSATFRHPAMLAKQATAMDHITGGRFILGLGAGWHVGEHEAFGIELPPMPERFDRFESTLRVLRALWSPEAARAPGVDLDAPPYRLERATNEPPPLTPGGPPIWLGGQRRRGLSLAARFGDGWNYGAEPGSLEEFTERRDGLRRACEGVGRDPAEVTVSIQMDVAGTPEGRREAVQRGVEFVRGGCEHLILRTPPELGPRGLQALASEVAIPIREGAPAAVA